ncbi:hypothetical protein ES703_102225 [subsurface metagenome]
MGSVRRKNYGYIIRVIETQGATVEIGEKGAIEIALAYPLIPDELYEIKSQLYSYGEFPKVYYHNSKVPSVRIDFTKGVDWMMIIGSMLAAATIAGVGAIGYAIYKTAETTPWIIPVALAGVGAALLLRAATRQEKVRARLPV